MFIRPLRTILSRQTALVALLPFVVVAIGIGGWLYPTTKDDTELHQQQIAVAVVSRVASYLDASSAMVRGVAKLRLQGGLHWSDLQQILAAQVAASDSLGILYAAEHRGTVRAVALRGSNEGQHQDLLGLDLSRNQIFPQLGQLDRLVWSDTFLSVVGGGLSVAQAVRGPDMVVFAEIRLDRLTEFLARIGNFGDEEIYLLDRHGNVVVDDAGRFTAKQVSLSNLTLVKRGLGENKPVTGAITLHGVEMIGSFVPIGDIGWSVLVAQPVRVAYRAFWGTLGVIGGSLVLALVLGYFLATRMANKLARRFELLAAHARKVVDKQDAPDWPQSNIAEFQELTADVQKMADTIRQREQEQATLMRNIPGMVYRCANDAQWAMSFVSDGCLTLTGYPVAAFLGDAKLSYATLIHEEDRERVWHDVQEALLRHRPFAIQYRIVTAAGLEKWVFEHGQGIFAPEGTLLSLEGIITDISEQVKLEEQLRQAQKMDSIGQLAGGVAHDFNNMLTAIMGSAEIIHMELAENHPLQVVTKMILKAANKSADLIRKLLVFSRKAPRQLELLDLHQVLREALHLLERSIDKRIEIVCQFTEASAIVMGDAGQLENAFLNICLNARDAMPNGGTVRVLTQPITLDEESAAQLGATVVPGDYIKTTITDTGAGMTRDVQNHIFEPFFTTKQVGKGTGLGLAAVYGTMKEHGAAITVTSEPGQGSTFSLYFPVSAEQSARVVPGTSADVPHGKLILFADDEEFLRQVGSTMLKEIGLKVLLASDGREAIDIFAARWREIDLVMLDVVMPLVNGRDAFQIMKEINPALTVLFMSGYARDTSVEDLMCDHSVAGFIQKPYRLEDIKQALANTFSPP